MVPLAIPSTRIAWPLDPFGGPESCGEGVLSTLLLEEFTRPEQCTGIDILRTIRSVDPGMSCTLHLNAGERVLHRGATSCACGQEA